MTYQQLGLLQEQFCKQAALTPDRIAVVDGNGRQVTYKQLDEWTNHLAAVLRQMGVCENRLVVIYMERCLQYVVAYIAILKSGGAYLPMDISYPGHLINDVLDEAEPCAIMTKSDLVENLPNVYQGTTIKFDDESWETWLAEQNLDSSMFPIKTSFEATAFVVYSSGTTGKPKGIAVPQRAAVVSYYWRHSNYPYVGQEQEACNVFFVWEMLRPLLKGHTLHVVPDDVIYDPRHLLEFLKERQITRMLFTPSLLEAVLELEKDQAVEEAFKSIKQVWLCGEVVTTNLLDRCLTRLPWLRVVNLYSVSECHDVAACDLTHYYNENKVIFEEMAVEWDTSIKTRKFCPVGKLLPGVRVHILDEDHLAQPVGVPGEIFVAGPTLARGYLKRPDLNLSKFLPLPESLRDPKGDSDGPERMYRTGDWGYVLSDGSLEICGRCDTMVKIRGYSVEVQAVEVAIMGLECVKACVVLAHGEEGEDKALVGYIVPEGNPTTKHVRAQLKRRLPFYMIPSFFLFLKEIPLVAASGKLDKRALPPFDKAAATVEPDFLPKTETEKRLAPIWMEVLQLNEIDIQEGFFDLGGHSLLATKLLNMVNDQFGSQLTVKDLFKFPSLSAIARVLDQRESSPEPDEVNLDLRVEVDNHDQSRALDLDIQLRAFWRFSRFNDARWEKGCVLLTGATGFLGAFILRDLLQMTQSQIFCLVRESSSKTPENRIQEVMVSFGILPNRDMKSPRQPTDEQIELEQLFERRVTPVKGDISLVRFGLSEEDYAYLCTEIDYVIHAAAYVNLVYPYEAVYSPNVLGTQNVILFASKSKVKPIHYVSTDAVFPHGLAGCREDADMLVFHNKLPDGYGQSKWVAEQLVMRACGRGHPVIIYRLGNLSGDSRHAGWNPADFNLLMLRGIATLGCGPKVNWKVEMTPVDFTSRVIVEMTSRVGRYAGKVLHLMNTKPLHISLIYGWLNAHGYAVEEVPYADWLKRVSSSKLRFAGQLARLLEDMVGNAEFFEHLSTYENRQTLTVLKELNITYPTLDSSLLTVYFNQLARQREIPAPRRNTLRADPECQVLDGCVAIVTGASSGIGQAVAVHLGGAGCMVALAARRLDKLLQVKAAVESVGGTASAVSTDVTNMEQVKHLIETTEATLGPIDIIVNCAGVMYYTLMTNQHVDEWMQQIDINCKGIVNSVGAVLPNMVKRGRGHIINLSSDAGRKPFPGLAVYSGTKYFVEGFSQALRLEVASKGVKVTCIQPGDVRTPLQNMSTDPEAVELYSDGGKSKILEAEDIGRAVVYAASQPDYCSVNEILIEPRDCPT